MPGNDDYPDMYQQPPKELPEPSAGPGTAPQGITEHRRRGAGGNRVVADHAVAHGNTNRIVADDANRIVANGVNGDTIARTSKNSSTKVRIRIEMGKPGVDGEHLFEWTGSDLRSYLVRVRGGVSLALRARIFRHEPEIDGPLRLYTVPSPGDLIILHHYKWSLATHLGQRVTRDADITSSMRATARHVAEQRAQGPAPMGPDDLAGLFCKLLGGKMEDPGH